MGNIKLSEDFIQEGVRQEESPAETETAQSKEGQTESLPPETALQTAAPLELLEESVFEDKERREPNVRHYCMPDGNFQAVIYPDVVNYYNEEQQAYRAIDNSFEWKESADANDFTGYENKYNGFKIKLAENADGKELMRVQKNGHSAVWQLLGKRQKGRTGKDAGDFGGIHKNRRARIAGKSREPDGQDRKQSRMTPSNIESEIVYDDAFAATDLQYILRGNKLKENIIVKEKAEEYVYAFRLKTQKLSLKLSADQKSLNFISNRKQTKGEVVFSIPAPCMTDAEGKYSEEVSFEVTKETAGTYLFKVIADAAWINAEETKLPVKIDPTVVVSPNEKQSLLRCFSWWSGYSIIDFNEIFNLDSYRVEYSNSCSKLYLMITRPTMLRNQNITDAAICFDAINEGFDKCELGLARTELPWPVESRYYNGERDKKPFAVKNINSSLCSYRINTGSFLADGNINFVLAMDDATISSCQIRNLTVAIDYKDTFGMVPDWEHNSHDAGRAGTGCVNLFNGNLVFRHDDASSSGNRMPVQISHYYNAARADERHIANSFSKDCDCEIGMNLGKGWKLNVQESILPIDRTKINLQEDYQYIYCDDSGYERFLKKKKKEVKVYENNQVKVVDGKEVTKLVPVKINDTPENNEPSNFYYEDEDGQGLEWNPVTRILSKNGLQYKFNLLGYLYEVEDSYGNTRQIVYNRKNQIVKVIDGAGKVFALDYDTSAERRLLSIMAPDGNLTRYKYEDGRLIQVVYADGNYTKFVYKTSGSKALKAVVNVDKGIERYGVQYVYHGDSAQVVSVTETNGPVEYSSFGQKTDYAYDTIVRRTTANSYYEDESDQTKQITTYYHFDQNGKTVSSYINSPEVQNVSTGGYHSGVNPYMGGGVNYTANVINLLQNHNFESTNSVWKQFSGTEFQAATYTDYSQDEKLYGIKSARVQAGTYSKQGLYQDTIVLQPGKYTLSAYVKISVDSQRIGGAFIEVTGADFVTAPCDCKSEYIKDTEGEFKRVYVSFELRAAASVKVLLGVENENCTAYFDAVQLEPGETCNDYNILENGSFDNRLIGWSEMWSEYWYAGTIEDGSNNICRIPKGYNIENIGQIVPVRPEAEVLETFVFSGWAKAPDAIVKNDPQGDYKFGLRAVIHYASKQNEPQEPPKEFSVPFLPHIDGWQFISLSFAKEKYKSVSQVAVYIDYNNQLSDAYFDNLQLTRTSITTVDESYFNPPEEKAPEPSETAEKAEIPDNVDYCGNTLYDIGTAENASGAFYKSYKYSDTGSDLISETDERGVETRYGIDPQTGQILSTEKPDTAPVFYEYDKKNPDRLLSVRSNAGGTVDPHAFDNVVNYDYDYLGNLSEIRRSGYNYNSAYGLGYNPFGRLQSIAIGTGQSPKTPLIAYEYKNQNGRVKKISYANGDYVTCVYNGLGRLTEEKWYRPKTGTETADPLTAHYNYVYDGSGNIVKSIDNLLKTEYNYYYEDGKIVRATQYSFTMGTQEDTLATDYWASSFAGSGFNTLPLQPSGTEVKYSYSPQGAYQSYSGGMLAGIGSFSVGLSPFLTREIIVSLRYPNGLVQQKTVYNVGSGTWPKFHLLTTGLNAGRLTGGLNINEVFDISQVGIYQAYLSFVYGTSAGVREHTGIERFTVGDATAPMHTSKTLLFTQDYRYKGGQLVKVTETKEGTAPQTYLFTASSAPGGGKSVSLSGGYTAHTLTDGHGRLAYRQVQTSSNTLLSAKYLYLEGKADKATFGKVNRRPETNLVEKIVYDDGDELRYSYDQANRIKAVHGKSGKLLTRYEYDGLGQLTREDNADLDTTVTYSYDAGGNITEKRVYKFTLASDLGAATQKESATYGYDTVWKDKLTTVSNYRGMRIGHCEDATATCECPDIQTFTYDASGNPLTYGAPDRKMTWEKGRQLKSYNFPGNNLAFTYNANGVRVQKNTGGVVTDYIVNGTKILWENKSAYSLKFEYDESGTALGVTYKRSSDQDSKTFFYKRNLQGDVIAVTDSLGRTLGTYTYDAYGKVTVKTTPWGDKLCGCNSCGGYDIYGDGYYGDCDCDEYRIDDRDSQILYINPIRYRGYYYDTESGLYYLNSRYYDPEIGRFVNADDANELVKSGAFDENLFVYCGNDPVNRKDESGRGWLAALLALAAANPVAAIVIGVIVMVAILVITANAAKAPSISWSKKSSQSSIGSLRNGLASKCKNRGIGKCDVAAKDMIRYLKNNGRRDYKVWKLRFANTSKIGSFAVPYPKKEIGDTGFHIGVEFEGRVHCVVHPDGMPLGAQRPHPRYPTALNGWEMHTIWFPEEWRYDFYVFIPYMGNTARAYGKLEQLGDDLNPIGGGGPLTA